MALAAFTVLLYAGAFAFLTAQPAEVTKSPAPSVRETATPPKDRAPERRKDIQDELLEKPRF